MTEDILFSLILGCRYTGSLRGNSFVKRIEIRSNTISPVCHGKFMLLMLKDLKSCLRFFIMSLPDHDRAIQRNELDYPVKPDNDDHWNGVRYELNGLIDVRYG
jgi:hypothetical protein